MCQTPEEAFRAGYEEPCEHGIHPVPECPECRLTPGEIARLAVLLRGLRPAEEEISAA
ncbi:hypothetical protein [Streptomyces sp. NPDC093261]|uniref:hypothetical protein n=1 Tax=Streptomyces sp. NPDC093261 TaxID=3366037 RepID=UPI0037FA7578